MLFPEKLEQGRKKATGDGPVDESVNGAHQNCAEAAGGVRSGVYRIDHREKNHAVRGIRKIDQSNHQNASPHKRAGGKVAPFVEIPMSFSFLFQCMA